MPRGQHPCPSCGKIIGNRSKRCRHCGAGDPVMHPGGYVRRYAPGHPLARGDGYVQEHRWMFHEMAIPIPDKHHVHHINGRKDDNRWSNLELMSKSDHHRHHVRQAGVSTNQYGTFPVLFTAEERRQRNIDRLRRRRQGWAAWYGGRWDCR